MATDLGRLANGVPGSLGSLLQEQLQHVAATDHARASLGFVVSLVLAVSSASAGVNHLDGAIRVAYELPQRHLAARGQAFGGVSGSYTAVYGAFAGAVIAMLGIYLAVYVVLLGAVLNRQVDHTPLGPRSGSDADVEDGPADLGSP